MNILAISDRPAKESIVKLVKQNAIDLICTLGDLEYFDLQELELITDIPKIGVYGNHDSGSYFEPLGITNMHLNTFEHQGIKFGGFQGCVRYKENPSAIMCTQEEATELLKEFPRVDVMLAHCPPYGINDDPTEISHTGFVALKEYLDQHKPSYLFHGHTYPAESELTTQYQTTKILYVYGHRIVDL